MVSAAAVTAQQVSTQRRAAALFDGRHHAHLAETQIPTLRFAQGRTVLAEDVGDLEGRSLHAVALQPIGPLPGR